jgi:hypothetical protein
MLAFPALSSGLNLLTQQSQTQTFQSAKPRNARAIVCLIVNEQGLPESIRLEGLSDPAFGPNALACVRKYRFKPALLDGKPVAFQLTNSGKNSLDSSAVSALTYAFQKAFSCAMMVSDAVIL